MEEVGNVKVGYGSVLPETLGLLPPAVETALFATLLLFSLSEEAIVTQFKFMLPLLVSFVDFECHQETVLTKRSVYELLKEDSVLVLSFLQDSYRVAVQVPKCLIEKLLVWKPQKKVPLLRYDQRLLPPLR